MTAAFILLAIFILFGILGAIAKGLLTTKPNGALAKTRNAPRIWSFGGALVLSGLATACIAQATVVSAHDGSVTDFVGRSGPSAGAVAESGDNPGDEYVNKALAAAQDRLGEQRQAIDWLPVHAQERQREERQAIHWNPARTAKNNGGAGQGDALELTWSIIPDGTLVASTVGEPDCLSTLVASLNAAYGAGKWQAEMEKVWADWSGLTGNIYTPAVPLDENGTPIEAAPAKAWGLFPSGPGLDGVRGDIRVGGCAIDGTQGTNTLAFNYFPASGDMKIDTENLQGLNLTTEFHNLFSHEHGHGAGLMHACPTSRTTLMQPFLSTAFIGLQHDDIRALQRLYGDRFEKINAPNDTAGTATRIDPYALPDGQTELQLSMDSTSDEDWFQFSGTAGAALDVSVAPNGRSYRQGSSCKPINSLSIQDLSFEIRTAGEVLSVVDATSVGNSESATGFILPTTGTYYVRVLGVGTDDSQLYDITVSGTTAAERAMAEVSITNTDGMRTAVAKADTLTYVLVVATDGPVADPNVFVEDEFPDALTCSYTSVANGGASGNTASGDGDVADFLSMPANSTVRYVATCLIAASTTGIISNTATATPSAPDPQTSNNSATDSTTIVAPPRSVSLSPSRLYESRNGPNDKTIDGKQQGLGRTPAGQTTIINVAGRAGIPTNATAVFLNVVAATPSGPGFVTVYPCGTNRPLAANVNYNGNDVGSNAVLAKIGTDGNICVFTYAETDLIIDVNGYTPAFGSTHPVSPGRLYESRNGPNDKTIDGKQQGLGRTPAGQTTIINVAGRAGIPTNAT
ncbi:MAG: hypothetical protein ACI8RC_001562, partial [Ilumatobacter sp.]